MFCPIRWSLSDVERTIGLVEFANIHSLIPELCHICIVEPPKIASLPEMIVLFECVRKIFLNLQMWEGEGASDDGGWT